LPNQHHSLGRSLGWVILGTGNIAGQFAEGLRYVPNARLVGVGSRDDTRGREFARAFNVPRTYGSYEEAVGDKDADVVYVATPNHRHKDDCLLALGAGKAVLCEKPFALNAAEARDVVALARRRRLFCMEAMWMRFLPLMARLRGLVDDRVIGEIQLVRADFGIPKPFDEGNRFFSRAMGGGAMLNFGVYLVSLASWLLGKPSAIATEASFGRTGIDEQSAAVLRYPQGAIAVLTSSIRNYLPCEVMIFGSRGEIRIHSPAYRPHRLTLTVCPTFPTVSPARRRHMAILRRAPLVQEAWSSLSYAFKRLVGKSVKRYVDLFDGNGFNYEAAEVTRLLQAGELESPIMPLDETLSIMETMDAIRHHMEGSFVDKAAVAVNSIGVDS
jgi:predicted dehydrogenase